MTQGKEVPTPTEPMQNRLDAFLRGIDEIRTTTTFEIIAKDVQQVELDLQNMIDNDPEFGYILEEVASALANSSIEEISRDAQRRRGYLREVIVCICAPKDGVDHQEELEQIQTAIEQLSQTYFAIDVEGRWMQGNLPDRFERLTQFTFPLLKSDAPDWDG